MSRQTQEKEIDGAVWSVAQFPATEGLAILTKLVKLLGPTVAAVTIARGDGNASRSDLLAAALRTLVERLDEHDVVALAKRLIRDVRKDGREIAKTFDTEFMGGYMTLFKVLQFVLEANYVDFFDVLSGTEAKPEPLKAVRAS